MSESPWNVKHTRSGTPGHPGPQGMQAGHVPRHAPAGPRPQARMVGKPPRQQPPPQPEPARPQRQRRRAAKADRHLSIRSVALLAAMILLLVATAVMMHDKQQRLDALMIKHRVAQEHYRARANSGYLGLIEKYAKEYGVNPSFVSAIIKCESSYRADAVSRVNARGLMQIMPDTGIWMAKRLKMSGYQPDDLFDPEINIRFGTAYLSYLSDIFSGSPVMVAAAFHAGDNNVKRWALNRSQDKKTIELEQIPTSDTKSYVRKVMDAYAIYFEKDKGNAPVDGGGLPPVDRGDSPGK
ncbi:MAG: lytic transglycosylase domain-containing protein [Christensenellales bacterium]